VDKGKEKKRKFYRII